jgi:hypothetical protein
MKRSALFIVLVIVCFAAFLFTDAANASAKKSASQEPQVQGPAFTFESTVYDFNNISPGSYLTRDFKFTNTGDSLLEITDIQAICGCTIPSLDQKQYAPGETGTIKVAFYPGSSVGPVTRQIHILSNDKRQPIETLTLKANIVIKVEVNPETVMLSLKQPNAGSPDITLTSLDGKAFGITNFQPSLDCIRLDFDPNYQATKLVLKPVIDVEKLKKSPTLKGNIRISISHPECKEISVFFDAPALYKMNPPTLLLFNTEPLKPITRDKVWLLSNYNEDFQIESTSSKNGFIKVATSEKVSPDQCVFSLQITPPKLPDPSKTINYFTDVLFIKIKGGEQVELSCRGYYAKQKTAAAEP